MFALPISKLRFKAFICNQNSPKMNLFLQKTQNFLALGAPPHNPRASSGWGLCPQTPHWPPLARESAPRPPKQPHPLRISDYALVYVHCLVSALHLMLTFMSTLLKVTHERSNETNTFAKNASNGN